MRGLSLAINNVLAILAPLALVVGTCVVCYYSWANGDIGREFDLAPPISAAVEVDR